MAEQTFEEVRRSLHQETKSRVTQKAATIFGRSKGITFVVFTSNLEFSWCVLKEQGTFPIPLTYVNVTRATHTSLDVFQESRVDNYWNTDMNRNLSKSWTGFTKFKILNEKIPKGYMWSSGRLVKKFKQLPDLTICGQKCVPTCHKQLHEWKSINGYR